MLTRRSLLASLLSAPVVAVLPDIRRPSLHERWRLRRRMLVSRWQADLERHLHEGGLIGSWVSTTPNPYLSETLRLAAKYAADG